MKELEVLLNQRWVLKSENKELYYQLRDAIGDIRKYASDKLGCQVTENALMVKMEKIPVIPENFMGILDFSSKEEYAFLCILLMFLEEKDTQEQFILSQLTEYISANMPGESIDWTVYTSRRRLIKVLRYAVTQGIVSITDGADDAFISVKAEAKVNASNLFMDQDALKHAPAKKFTRKQKHAFETLYSTLNTAYTTDVDTHIKKQKKAWKQNEVKISGTKASLITVVFHSSFGENENELFIGHAGVLVPTKDKKLLFVEKLSFSLPYQVLKFDNRKQLKNYLMGMYDTSWGQEEAKPFITENTKTVL